MSGYTKGPWEYEWSTSPYYSDGEVISGDKKIAIVCGSNYGEWRDADDCGEAEFQANAALIAAAPDLLEALEQLFRIGDVYPSAIEHDAYGEEGGKMDLEQWTDLAKAAIAKARGEK